MRTPVVVGVDNGGTWIRLKGLDKNGRCVWSLKKPSPTVEKLPAFLKKHLHRFRGGLQGLAVGSRGVWKPSKRREMTSAFQGLAKNIVVMSDVEAAWLSAFGLGGEGIVVISGTGSIAYGRTADGSVARAGGLGPDKGDEGSGHWIGRAWLVKQRSPQTLTVRQIASLAPAIIRKAHYGNPLARKVVRGAQDHLAALVVDLARDLSWKGTLPLSISGSVLENAWLQRGFFRVLRKNKIDFQFIRKKTDPALAPLAVFFRPS